MSRSLYIKICIVYIATYTTGIKLSIFWNFGTHFLWHEINQTYFISAGQRNILTLASYAFIHKIRKKKHLLNAQFIQKQTPFRWTEFTELQLHQFADDNIVTNFGLLKGYYITGLDTTVSAVEYRSGQKSVLKCNAISF